MLSSSPRPPRRIGRLLLRLALGAITLLLLGAASVYAISEYKLRRLHSIESAEVAIPSDAAAIERGRHLATSRGCADCHAPDFGGRVVVDDPAIGRFAAPNLTNGRGGLASEYSDSDYIRAIRHGLAHDGRGLFLMPSEDYTGLSDEDLGALIAYLKSVPAVDRDRIPIRVGPMGRILMTVGEIKLTVEKIDHQQPRPLRVEAGQTVEYGRYIATSCIGCHGENFSGGRIAGAPPEWPPAANLTPHATAGVTTWSEADFFTALRHGRRPDGSQLNPAMPATFGQFTDDEIKALWLYLRTLPAAELGVRGT